MHFARGSRTTVETLAEDYLGRLRKGENPTIAEYRRAYPELRDEIQAVFPALKLVENFAPQSEDAHPAAKTFE